jgi:hypothetical protein
MMQSFVTSGSHTWGANPNEVFDRSDAEPFPKENAIMMVFWDAPCWGGTTGPAWAPGFQLTVVGFAGAKGVMAHVLHSTQVKI